MKFIRITVNPRQMGGVPCIRGLRIPVATVVGMVADGITTEEILRAYPIRSDRLAIDRGSRDQRDREADGVRARSMRRDGT